MSDELARRQALADAAAVFRHGARVWAKEPTTYGGRDRNLFMYEQAASTLEMWADDPSIMDRPLRLARDADA